VHLIGEAFCMPQVWDVEEGFGGVKSSLAGYVGNRRISLAARVGLRPS
jgi:hypothetical protein